MTTGMIVCAQGDPQCYQAGCRRTPTLQCDYVIDHWGNTCNAWMCESHALAIGFGRDYCMGHQPPKEQARMTAALYSIPAEDRDTWVQMGMAIKSELGDGGFDLWDS